MTVLKSKTKITLSIHSILSQLSLLIPENSTIVCADGTACVVTFQVFQIKENQRLFHNSGCASMGYEIPASIGAYYSTHKPVYCIAGDGSIMMNIQELAIIGRLNLPIVIFVLNNKGYSSIRQIQKNYFPDNIVIVRMLNGLSRIFQTFYCFWHPIHLC